MSARHLDPTGQVGLVDGGDGRWDATTDDPQFHFVLDAPQPAGVYRWTAWLDGEAADAPRLYLDHGDNWTEASALALQADAGSAAWTHVGWLPAFSGGIRLDPGDRAGALRFGGLAFERLDGDVAMLSALAAAADTDPLGLGRRLALARDAIARGDRVAAWTAVSRPGAIAMPGAPSVVAAVTADATAWAADDPQPAIQQLARRPLLTIVSTAGDDPGALAATWASLVAQAWPDWELLVAVDPGHPAADTVLDGLPRSTRLRAVAAAADADGLATLLAAADGSWICLASPGLAFAPDALLAVAAAVDGRESLRLAYGDLARVESPGAAPVVEYRPDWNPALAAAQDYVRDPAWLHRPAIDAAPPSAGVAGWPALHHDLVLRVAGDASAEDVLHLPRVLATGQGTAVAADPVVPAAHFERMGCPVASPGEALRGPGLPDPPPAVALLIPTRDRLDLLRRCVDSVLALSTWPDLQVVIVDNQSREPETLAWFEAVVADPRVRVLRFDEPFNYSRINNFAVSQVDADIVGLLNNDVEVITPGWIEELVRHAARPDVGAAGAMLYYPDDTIQHAGVVVGLGGVAGHAYPGWPRGSHGHAGRLRLPQDLSAVTAACLLVRREVYLAVGGFDEGLAVAFNDVDFCLRLRAAGYRIVWTPYAELYHHESASRGSEDTDEKRARFGDEVRTMQARWRDALQHDPAYHPRLSLVTGEDFLPAAGLPQAGPDPAIDAWLHGGPAGARASTP